MEKVTWLDPHENTAAAVKEVTARMLIEMTDMLEAVAACWVLYVSLTTFARFWSYVRTRDKVILGAFLVLGTLAYLVLWFDLFDLLPNPFTDSTLMEAFQDKACSLTSRSDFGGKIAAYLDYPTHVALIAVAFVAGIVAAKPKTDDSDVREGLNALTNLLLPSAFLVVIHVVTTGSVMLWPAELLPTSDSTLVTKLAVAMTLNCAVFYTVLLIGLHMPAVHAVTTQASELEVLSHMPIKARYEWLTKRELSDNWTQYYARIGTVLSPLIAGIPLVKLLTFILSRSVRQKDYKVGVF
ncbi:MAG TPA: hypothetical protein VH107_21470 [Lacipirellulaceae bacterium]|nr:hypothetical protein [Lacipirellulaceae bacterium]